MSSRYGRNKRREHRQQIEALRAENAEAQARARAAERRVATALEDGMDRVLAIRHLPQLTERIAVELARNYGPEIAEAAQELIRSGRRRSAMPVIDFTARVDVAEPTITVLRGRIKELHYNVAVSHF